MSIEDDKDVDIDGVKRGEGAMGRLFIVSVKGSVII
jgi:hypothetical protein